MRFADVAGHESAKRRMVQMVERQRLPHAFMLSAPVGSGEMMLARALVQFLHCTGRRPGQSDSCGECPSCRRHAAMNHADLHFVFPVLKKGTVTLSDDWMPEWRDFLASDPWMDFRRWPAMLGKPDGQPMIYVDDSEQLVRKMSLAARASDLNVALIWLPERLNDAAANRLLKLIEEPEEGTFFLLVSNDPGAVLPTIMSRCQRIELRRLPDSTVAEVIGGGIEPADALAAAHIAEGNVIAAADALRARSDSSANLDLFMQLMRLAYAKKVSDLKIWSEKVADLKRDGAGRFLQYCQRMIRENFILNLQVDGLNYLTAAESQFSSRFCPFINHRNVEGLIAEFNLAERDIRGNGSAKIVLFDLAIKVIMLLHAKD